MFITRQIRVVMALTVGLLAVAAAMAAPAPAQTCGPADPYSGGNPNCEQQAQLAIQLSTTSGPPGTNVVVDATGFKQGNQGTITFGGNVVATGTASSDPGTFQATAAEPASATIHKTIVVPSIPAGTYDVCISGPNAQSACKAFRVTPGTEVAGVSFTRGGTGSSLAKTGLTLLPFLLLAVILILGGRYLVAQSRSRRV